MFVNYLGKGETKEFGQNTINILCDITNPEPYSALGYKVLLSLNNKASKYNLGIAHNSKLNLVQNSDFYISVAKYMKNNFKIPYIVLDNRSCSVLDLQRNLESVNEFFKNKVFVKHQIKAIVTNEINQFIPQIIKYRTLLEAKMVFITQNELKNSALFKNIINQIGLIITEDYKEADIVLGEDDYESFYIKIGKSFCNIHYGKNLNVKGYLGVLKFYKELHLCNKKVSLDSKMYGF